MFDCLRFKICNVVVYFVWYILNILMCLFIVYRYNVVIKLASVCVVRCNIVWFFGLRILNKNVNSNVVWSKLVCDRVIIYSVKGIKRCEIN